MKVNIDSSIFSREKGAFGNVTGSIELVVIPQIGDTIIFSPPTAEAKIDSLKFNGVLKVTARIFSANSSTDEISIALTDIMVDTEQDAAAVADYLEVGFNLFATIYEK